MDAHAHVALAAHGRLARVDAHPDAKVAVLGPRVVCEPELAGNGSRDGALGTAERDEERVALRVDLAAVVLCEGFAQDPAMVVEGLTVELPPEELEQLRRALDVCEEEGDGAYGQFVD